MIFRNTSIIVLFFIALSTSPAIFLGDGNRNLLLISVLFLFPLLLIKFLKIDRIDLLPLSMLLIMLIAPYFTNYESYRLSTILYSMLFILIFITYKQLLFNADFSIHNYIDLIKFILFSYFVVLLIQQFCVLTGLPIFNVSSYSSSSPWKLNSLSAEPSHTARIVPILMFSYIVAKEIILNRKYSFDKDFKDDRYLWIAFLWIVFTSGSATAHLFFVLIFFKFLSLKNIINLSILILLFIGLINLLDITSFQRTINFTMAVLTLDINTMMEVDHSASLRVVPFILLLDLVDVSTFEGWFGHGIDYVSTFMSDLIPGVPDGMAGGALLLTWMEYGFLVFILFIIYTFLSVFNKKDLLTIVFWFLLIFLGGINSQMTWLAIVLLYTNTYYLKIKRNK